MTKRRYRPYERLPSDEELSKLYPPYEHSYITERNPPATLAQMRAEGELRRQRLSNRNPDMARRVLYEWSQKTGLKPGAWNKGGRNGKKRRYKYTGKANVEALN